MQETIELRVVCDYFHLLFKESEGKQLGSFVKLVEISTDDPRFLQIPIIAKEIDEKYDRLFFYSWQIKRKYTEQEIKEARLFRIIPKVAFEPAGQDCGTVYDESFACEICGANRKQLTPLHLPVSRIPKKDFATTIASEMVVSDRLVRLVRGRGFKGFDFGPIYSRNKVCDYYQLKAEEEVDLSPLTVAGCNPYNFSEGHEAFVSTIQGYTIEFEKTVYKCPKGHLIGLNLISEPYVLDTPLLKEYDFMATRQQIGAKQGLLRPKPIYLCSPAFRQMVIDEKLKGFDFEVAYVV